VSTFHSSVFSIIIGGGGILICPGRGSVAALRSFSDMKIRCILMVFGNWTLYKCPTRVIIGNGPAIWLSSLWLGWCIRQVFVVTKILFYTSKSIGVRVQLTFLRWVKPIVRLGPGPRARRLRVTLRQRPRVMLRRSQ